LEHFDGAGVCVCVNITLTCKLDLLKNASLLQITNHDKESFYIHILVNKYDIHLENKNLNGAFLNNVRLQ
jgi:hypothetical protein